MRLLPSFDQRWSGGHEVGQDVEGEGERAVFYGHPQANGKERQDETDELDAPELFTTVTKETEHDHGTRVEGSGSEENERPRKSVRGGDHDPDANHLDKGPERPGHDIWACITLQDIFQI